MRRTWMFLPSIVAACGGSDSAAPLPPVDEAALEVEVVALAQTVHPLDPVVARITNRSTEVVYENLCGGALEGYGYVPGEWNGSYGYGRACPLGCALSGRARVCSIHFGLTARRMPAPGASTSTFVTATRTSYRWRDGCPSRSWWTVSPRV